MKIGGTHQLSLPGSDGDKRVYARVMGSYMLATENMATFAELTAYCLGLAIELSNRPTLFHRLAPTVAHFRAIRPDDTGRNYKRNEALPPEIAATPIRVACPRTYADLYAAREHKIAQTLDLTRHMTFKEFAKLTFLVLDAQLAQNPNLMRRLTKTFPPSYFGLQ